MSRSHKKVCAGGICTGSNHEWFKQEHRRERRTVKQLLHIFQDETLLPHRRHYANPYESPTDGWRIYWYPEVMIKDHFDDWERKMYKKLLRK